MSDLPTSGTGSEHWYDTESGTVMISDDVVQGNQFVSAFVNQHPELAALVKWSSNTTVRSRKGNLFERDRYLTPEKIFDQFDIARHAATHDDVVSGVLETLESLAFSRVDFEVEDEDEEDVWNQIAADLDLDSRLREMWRELNVASQIYCAVYWGKKSYKVRGKSEKGVTRKKVFSNLKVPLGLTLLDPKKVVPVGNFLFNKEKLVYIADTWEAEAFDRGGDDEIVKQMLLGKYTPTEAERKWIMDLGVSATEPLLYLLNPQCVFRHTLTRPQFEHLAQVRLTSVFELLDMKTQLREMDRAHLIGATNFIVLVRKGTDERPATAPELQNLGAMVKMQARVPVLVGDHRLQVDIVTPNTDFTLSPEKYDVLDGRIATRLLQMFVNNAGGGGGMRGQDPTKLARVVAAGMESRRHMIRRTFERYVLKPMVEMNDQFTEKPSLAFHPRRIALDFDAALSAYLIDLRDRGEISRDTILSEFDYSQEDEAMKRKREKEEFDDIFETVVPFSGTGGVNGGGLPTDPAEPPRSVQGGKQGIPNKVGPLKQSLLARQARQQKTANVQDPRTGGRNRGGNRASGKSGGAAPGTNQGKTKDQQR